MLDVLKIAGGILLTIAVLAGGWEAWQLLQLPGEEHAAKVRVEAAAVFADCDFTSAHLSQLDAWLERYHASSGTGWKDSAEMIAFLVGHKDPNGKPACKIETADPS